MINNFENLKKYIICSPQRYKLNKKEYSKKQYIGFEIFEACMVNNNSIKEIDRKFKKKYNFKNLFGPKASHNIKFSSRDADFEINSLCSVGCALSHINLWSKCVDNNQPILIMEDDVFIKSNIKKEFIDIINQYLTNEKYYILYLCSLLDYKFKIQEIFRFQSISGYNYNKVSRNHSFNDLKNCIPCGMQAYVITPKVAKLLLNYCFPIMFHVDYFLMLNAANHNFKIDFIDTRFSPFYLVDNPFMLLTSNYLSYKTPKYKPKKFKKQLLINILEFVFRFIYKLIYIFQHF
jgi:GR25 family glycosyltransferase involved in LPS biosynthesis